MLGRLRLSHPSFVLTACRRATRATDAPASRISLTIRRFSSTGRLRLLICLGVSTVVRLEVSDYSLADASRCVHKGHHRYTLTLRPDGSDQTLTKHSPNLNFRVSRRQKALRFARDSSRITGVLDYLLLSRTKSSASMIPFGFSFTNSGGLFVSYHQLFLDARQLFSFPSRRAHVGTHPKLRQRLAKILNEGFRIIDIRIDSRTSGRCSRFDLIELKFMCDIFDDFG